MFHRALGIGALAGGLMFAGAHAIEPNADTFTAAGVLSGSAVTEAACAENPDTAVWVVVDGQGDCLRYFHQGLTGSAPTVHVHFHGDTIWQWKDGRTQIPDFYEGSASPENLARLVARGADETGPTPYIRFSRPGVYGSSGDHKRRRLARESALISAGLDVLKTRYGIETFAVSGQSGGGHVVASLLARRSDIGCAVATSGVLAVRKRSVLNGWGRRDITGFVDYYDPVDHVDEIIVSPKLKIFVMGDPKDTNTPFSSQKLYFDSLVSAGKPAWLIRAKGGGRSNHSLALEGFAVIRDCVAGMATDAIVRRHTVLREADEVK